MHDGQFFILAIVGMAMFAGVMKSAIRHPHLGTRHQRFQRAMGWGRWNNAWGDGDERSELADGRKVQLLTQENEKLNGQVSRLEERIRVLERIVTDPATRTAREIEELR